jgi:hypothetical protein
VKITAKATMAAAAIAADSHSITGFGTALVIGGW